MRRRLYLGNDIPIGGTARQAGMARFGTDPTSSVPDLDCKAYERDNHRIADASFLPLLEAASPPLTIIANEPLVG
jgi:choline dehydrogenase-like flavoprotein